MAREEVILGAGCFWCTEAAFQEIKGVIKVESGYSGGHVVAPSYEDVCTGETGHAEVIRLTFDPDVLPFKDVLEVYYSIHDPTTLNRQGNDIGTQYRSVIFYTSDRQKKEAEEKIKQLEQDRVFGRPIVTAVEKFSVFYPAEDYHRNYYKNNSTAPYCRAVISPKLDKLKKKQFSLLKA